MVWWLWLLDPFAQIRIQSSHSTFVVLNSSYEGDSTLETAAYKNRSYGGCMPLFFLRFFGGNP